MPPTRVEAQLSTCLDHSTLLSTIGYESVCEDSLTEHIQFASAAVSFMP